jgi:hypothetical protein
MSAESAATTVVVATVATVTVTKTADAISNVSTEPLSKTRTVSTGESYVVGSTFTMGTTSSSSNLKQAIAPNCIDLTVMKIKQDWVLR